MALLDKVKYLASRWALNIWPMPHSDVQLRGMEG